MQIKRGWFLNGLVVGVIVGMGAGMVLGVIPTDAAAPTQKPTAKKPAAQKPYQVQRISAQLFFQDTATFSDNVIDNKDLSLWNTIIGEGSANGHPSNSTLVKVTVKGPAKEESASPPPVEVTVKTAKAVLAKHTFNDAFMSNGAYSVALMVQGTGCQPVTIQARLLGGASSTMTKTIPFQCGE